MSLDGVSTGFNVKAMVNEGISKLKEEGDTLQETMTTITGGESVDQADLLNLQFAIGQYNAKMEVLSSITKSMQDMLKSLAQRTG